VIDTALDCVIVMDHRGDVVEWNPAAETTFGWRRDEAVGACLADLIIPPALRERHHRGLEHYLETGEGPVMDRRLELTGVRRDGSELPVELTITRMADTDPPVFTGYLRDITARTEYEAERTRLLERERSERRRAERAERRTAILAEAGRLIGTSLELEEALSGVARLIVPRLADWCVVDLAAPGGLIERLAVAHADAADAELAAALERAGPARADAAAGTPAVIRTGEPEFVPDVDDEYLQRLARSDAHLELLHRMDPASVMVVPLRARGRTLGAMALTVSRGTERRYDDDDLTLALTLAGRCALAIDNALLYRERSAIARTLQASLLPPHLPPIPGIDLGARYLPGGEGVDVGGDFYDVFQTGEGAWGVVIGDVRGKGAGAAALTGLVRHTLRAAAVSERGPERILDVLNEAILRGEEADDPFCTVVFACVEPSGSDLEVTLACAGHPLPLAVREGGTVESVGRPGTLLGVVQRPEVSEQKTVLRPGDALVLYTDGVPEARSRAGQFGLDRLEALLSSCAGATAERIAERIEHEVRSFQDEGRRDDLAVLVLRVPPVRAGESPEDGRGEPAPIGRS
jgi:PAS domain S-box-containing protein